MNRLTVEDTACKGQLLLTRTVPSGSEGNEQPAACKGQYLLLTRTVPSGSEGNEQTDR